MSKIVINDLIKIFRSSVSAVLPQNLIRKVLKYNTVNQQLSIFNEYYNLKYKNVYVIGTGKAVQNMAREVETLLNSKITKGIISIPEGSRSKDAVSENVYYYEGAKNNLPDLNAEMTALKIKDLAISLGKDDVLLVLISGGGSALLPLPKNPITLNEKIELIKKLACAGADIQELNTVRKQISDLKGGKLAMYAQPAQVICLILSDIVNDPIDLIASAPTVKNEDNIEDAIEIIMKYNLFDDIPDSIRSVLCHPSKDKHFPKENVKNYIIGSNKISIEAASNECMNLNYLPIVLSTIVTGNVTDVAKKYTRLVKIFNDFIDGILDITIMKEQINNLKIPGVTSDFLHQKNDVENLIKTKDLCLILGGEITVEVKGRGKGGRNQQLALEFSYFIHCMKEDFKNVEIFILSAGTDGIDGPTDAAGGIGYLNMLSDCENCNIDTKKYLEENDSYNFYKNFGNGKLHVITGHTNTNVMDIHLLIIKRNNTDSKIVSKF